MEDPAIALPDRGDGELDREIMAIAAQPHRLEPLADQAAIPVLQEPLQALPVELPHGLRHGDVGKALAHDLVRPPAERFLRCRVPPQDATLLIRRDERVG